MLFTSVQQSEATLYGRPAEGCIEMLQANHDKPCEVLLNCLMVSCVVVCVMQVEHHYCEASPLNAGAFEGSLLPKTDLLALDLNRKMQQNVKHSPLY